MSPSFLFLPHGYISSLLYRPLVFVGQGDGFAAGLPSPWLQHLTKAFFLGNTPLSDWLFCAQAAGPRPYPWGFRNNISEWCLSYEASSEGNCPSRISCRGKGGETPFGCHLSWHGCVSTTCPLSPPALAACTKYGQSMDQLEIRVVISAEETQNNSGLYKIEVCISLMPKPKLCSNKLLGAPFLLPCWFTIPRVQTSSQGP